MLRCYQWGQENLATCTACPGTTNTRPSPGTNCQSSACSAEHLHIHLIIIAKKWWNYAQPFPIITKNVKQKLVSEVWQENMFLFTARVCWRCPSWTYSSPGELAAKLRVWQGDRQQHVSYISSRRVFFLQLSNSIAFSLEMEKGNSGQLKKIHIVLVLVICDQYYFSFQFLGCNVLLYTDYNVLSWNDVSASVLNYRFKFRQVTKVIG